MMDIKQLFTEDDAVSPVIGVILMVAITVILAAVIGAFVLNIGGSQEAAPQAQIDFGYPGGDYVTVTHGGGGAIDTAQLSTSGSAWDSCTLNAGSVSAGEKLNSSSACTHVSGGSGQTLSITWTSESGEQSQVIAESTIP